MGTLIINPLRLWTPTFISTTLWLDAQDLSTITLNGTTVSQWDDKSGNGQHATQTLLTKQPTVQTINEHSAIYFDGIDDSMIIPSQPFIFGSISIFAIWDIYNTGFVYGTDNTEAESRIYISKLECVTGRLDGQQADYIRFNEYNDTTRISVQESTNLNSLYNSYLYRNGILQGSRLNRVIRVIDISNMRLGCRASLGTESVFSNSNIGEIIIINNNGSQLSSDTRQKVEGYLAHKWNLTINLPINNPYKNIPPYV
jgi:hypothetical protein